MPRIDSDHRITATAPEMSVSSPGAFLSSKAARRPSHLLSTTNVAP